MVKYFLILALGISVPAFGMRCAAGKFRLLIPTIQQRLAHSGLRDVSLDTEIAKLRVAVDEIEETIWNVIRERSKAGKFVRDSFEEQWLDVKRDWSIGPHKREELDMLRDLANIAKGYVAERKAAEKLRVDSWRKALADANWAVDTLRKETEKHSNVLAVGMNLPAERKALLKKIAIFLDGSSSDIGNLRAAIETAETAHASLGKEVVQGLEEALEKAKEALKCLEEHTSDRLKNSSKKD